MIIQELIDEGVLKLYLDFRARHGNDLSGNSNDMTFGASTVWTNNGIYNPSTSQRNLVSDSAELQLTTGTLILLADSFKHVTNERLLSKRDAGGTNWDFYLNPSSVALYNGATSASVNTDINGKRYVAWNFDNGNAPELFVDGLSIGSGTAIAISVDDASVGIGCYNSASHNTSTIQAALMINRELTATEHAELYAELISLKFPKKTTASAKAGEMIEIGTKSAQLLTDGNMEAADTSAYSAAYDATLTKEITNPHSGSQFLRVAYSITNYPYAFQSILTVGKSYRMTGWMRSGDGVAEAQARIGTLIGTTTTNTEWTYFDISGETNHAYAMFRKFNTGAGYVEFDDVTLEEVSGETATVLALDMKPINNTIIDASEGGHTASISGSPVSGKGVLGNYLDFDGTADHLVVTDHADFSFDGSGTCDSAMTISAWVNMDDATNFYIASKGIYNTSAEWRLLFSAADKLAFQIFDESVANCYIGRLFDTALIAQQGQFLHIVATYDGTGLGGVMTGIKLYINGEVVDDTDNENVKSSYVAMENLAADVHIGRYNTAYANGKISNVRIYNEEKTAAWVLKEYEKGARAVQFKTDWGANESVAAEGGVVGQYLSNTPFQLGDTSARYKVSTDTVDGELCKVIECTTAGLLYIPTSLFKIDSNIEAAYGTWEWWINKADASTTDIIFIADTIGNVAAGTQDGYVFRITSSEGLALQKRTGGTATNLITTFGSYTTAGEWHNYKITRTFLGLFTYYQDGTLVTGTGGFPNPNTDNTHTIADYVVIDFDAGDKLCFSDKSGNRAFNKHLGVV